MTIMETSVFKAKQALLFNQNTTSAQSPYKTLCFLTSGEFTFFANPQDFSHFRQIQIPQPL